jgi:hypothetical protein
MRTDDTRWRSFERSALPSALLGSPGSGVRDSPLEHALEHGRGIALGYPEGERGGPYSPPTVIILDDRAAAETLSWLRTYAPATFPLSQFARVVLRSDLQRFGEERPWRRAAIREDRWACVVLGELLAQGESDVDLPAVPLSWSASCFSTAIARTAILHPGEALEICLERLVVLEKDQRFARRQVAIAALRPVWNLAMPYGAETLAVPEAAEIVAREATRRMNGAPSVRLHPEILLNAPSDFQSDSVETRVVAFHRLTAQVMDEVGERTPTELASAMIAAAAFLVGRGSSHAFLLSRLPRRWPHTFTWFGLMAGLAGPRSWDDGWSRAAKGIERVIRGRFDWCGSSGADLSWPEYSWLATTFSGSQTYVELPKMAPKALSVEILPGAACQLRLAADAGAPARDLERGELVAAERSRELKRTLEELANLADRARQLIAREELLHRQASLGFDESRGGDPVAPRPRRNKQRSPAD